MSAALLLAWLPALAPQEPAPAPEEIVLAVVDGRPLTLADALAGFMASHTGHGALVRGEAAVRELAGRMVERALFLAEAETLDLTSDPQVERALESFLRDQVAQEFWARELRVQVSDEEVEAFYAKTDVALKLTLIETAERATAERLRARVAAGEDMAALAGTESIHSSRSLGGLLPYVRRGEIEPALEPAVFALEQPGELSPVVATRAGFAFARLEERSLNPTRLPREVALPQIRKILRDRAEDTLRAEVEARLERAGAIELVEERLTAGTVLGGGDADALVARAAGASLTLAELRDALDLDALAAQEPETVAGAARFAARDWAMRRAIWRVEQDGLVRSPALAARAVRQREELAMGLLCERYVWKDLEPSEAEVRAYYEANKASSFTRPPERRLAYCVVASEADGRALLARVQHGESFEALTKQLSLDRTSAVHGGRIGWIKQGEILPEVEARAFALPKGGLDGPIETPQGWFVVSVLDRREPELVPFEGARTAVLKRMLKERQQEAYSRWSARLRERADVQLDEAGVKAAAEWLARQPAAEPAPPAPGSPHGDGGR